MRLKSTKRGLIIRRWIATKPEQPLGRDQLLRCLADALIEHGKDAPRIDIDALIEAANVEESGREGGGVLSMKMEGLLDIRLDFSRKDTFEVCSNTFLNTIMD